MAARLRPGPACVAVGTGDGPTGDAGRGLDASFALASSPLSPGLEPQDEVADVDLVSLADDGRLGDLAPVHVRPVRTLQIGHDEPAVAIEKACVMLGHVPLREHQIVALHSANVDLVFFEALSPLGPALLVNDYREHSGTRRDTQGAPWRRPIDVTSDTSSGATLLRIDCRSRRATVSTSLASTPALASRPDLAGHLPQELGRQRDYIANLEATGAKLPVYRPRENG